MSDIIQILQEATAPEMQTAAQREALSALNVYLEQVGEAFSEQFLHELWRRDMEYWSIGLEDAFARGFRLGGQAMGCILEGE